MPWIQICASISLYCRGRVVRFMTEWSGQNVCISRNGSCSCNILTSNRNMLHWGTEHRRQQISHQTPNKASALLAMKKKNHFPSSFLQSIFLTVEPRYADGFNKHSKQNRCPCCKVVQESKHVHPSLERRRRTAGEKENNGCKFYTVILF